MTNIATNALILVFMLPVIITLIVLCRQTIGLKGFSIETPLLLGYSFMIIGPIASLLILILAFAIGNIFYYFLKDSGLLHLSKIGLILIFTSFIIIVLTLIFPYYIINFSIAGVFSFVFILSLTEKLFSLRTSPNFKESAVYLITISAIALVSYILYAWPTFDYLIIAYPFIIFGASAVITIFLGIWPGLKLSEYYRFREIAKK